MSVYNHENFIPLQAGATIWRYLDLEKFKSLLKDQALFFCRADKFSDPFEGSLPRREAENRMKAERLAAERFGRDFNKEQAKQNIAGIQLLHQKLKSATIVNCWHINENESDAMWRLYLKDNEGVAIQTNTSRIYHTIDAIPEKVGMSKVRYIDYDKEIWYHATEYPQTSYNLYTPLIHKRAEFRHESEFRLFIDVGEAVENMSYWESQSNHKGRLVNVYLQDLIEKIYFPPTADSQAISLVKKVCKTFSYNFEFVQSKLSFEPMY